MTRDDDLLDKITAHLRSEPVPEMPKQLLSRGTYRTPSWWQVAAASLAVAASIGGLLWLLLPPRPSLRPISPDVVQLTHPAENETPVIAVRIDLVAPLVELDAQLVQIESEIAELREMASLLDARHKADELLAQY